MITHGRGRLIVVLAGLSVVGVASAAIPAAAASWHVYADGPSHNGQYVQAPNAVTVNEATTLPSRVLAQARHLTAEPISAAVRLGEHEGTVYWRARVGADGVLIADVLGDGTVSVGIVSAAEFAAYGTATSTQSAAVPGARTAYPLPAGVSLAPGQPGLSATGSLVFDERPEATSKPIRTTDSRPIEARTVAGERVPPLTEIASLR